MSDAFSNENRPTFGLQNGKIIIGPFDIILPHVWPEQIILTLDHQHNLFLSDSSRSIVLAQIAVLFSVDQPYGLIAVSTFPARWNRFTDMWIVDRLIGDLEQVLQGLRSNSAKNLAALEQFRGLVETRLSRLPKEVAV